MISVKDESFVEAAYHVAMQSQCKSRHGCVVVKNGKMVSWGCNNYQLLSCSLSSKTTHAEVEAVVKYHRLKKQGQAEGIEIFVSHTLCGTN